MGYTEKEILDWMAGLGLTKSPLPPSGRVLEVEHLKNLRWEQGQDAFWVLSDVDPATGAYIVTVTYSDDAARVMDGGQALRYAAELHTAAAYAEYDAAVVKQLTCARGLDLAAAAQVVEGLRADRPPLDSEALGMVTLEAGVSGRTGKPFLHGRIGSVGLRWQWEPGDARQHAGQVLDGVAVAPMDAAYRRYLVGVVGLDDHRARCVVEDLANFRDHVSLIQ